MFGGVIHDAMVRGNGNSSKQHLSRTTLAADKSFSNNRAINIIGGGFIAIRVRVVRFLLFSFKR